MMTSVRLSLRSSSDSIFSHVGSPTSRCTNSWYRPAEITNRTVPIKKMSMIATVFAMRPLAALDDTSPARTRSMMTAATRTRPNTCSVADAMNVPRTARMMRNRLVPRMSRIMAARSYLTDRRLVQGPTVAGDRERWHPPPTRYDAGVTDASDRGAVGRTRLGNPANGDAPRPHGACRVLMIGDMIGKPGSIAVEEILPALRDERGIDFVTANGENVAGGMGLTASTADTLLAAGVDVITSGNHIWDKREIYAYLETTDRVLRPLNYGSHEVPGRGWCTYQALDGTDVAVINLQGRTYMQQIENPFTDADRLLDESSEPLPPVRLVDFHCELTSEKNALGLYLDGRVSVVAGTHTHIVTGDERILPNGTAYQTDLGMTGPVWSVIGFEPRTVIPRFINALPTRFLVGQGTVIFNALQVDIDPATGRALAMERIQRLVEA